jgi:hypothetical protein
MRSSVSVMTSDGMKTVVVRSVGAVARGDRLTHPPGTEGVARPTSPSPPSAGVVIIAPNVEEASTRV